MCGLLDGHVKALLDEVRAEEHVGKPLDHLCIVVKMELAVDCDDFGKWRGRRCFVLGR